MIILFGALCRENEEKQCFSCDIIDFFDDLWEQPKIYKKPNQKGKTLFLTWYHSLFIRNCVNINERNVWYHSLFIKIFVNIKNHKKRKSLTKASFLIKSFVKIKSPRMHNERKVFFSFDIIIHDGKFYVLITKKAFKWRQTVVFCEQQLSIWTHMKSALKSSSKRMIEFQRKTIGIYWTKEGNN